MVVVKYSIAHNFQWHTNFWLIAQCTWRKPLINLESRIFYLCSHFLGYELFQIENIWGESSNLRYLLGTSWIFIKKFCWKKWWENGGYIRILRKLHESQNSMGTVRCPLGHSFFSFMHHKSKSRNLHLSQRMSEPDPEESVTWVSWEEICWRVICEGKLLSRDLPPGPGLCPM